ncbi:MAG: hypothetical protein IJZ96_04140 [Lachnospiraceae bacterium]|nr:hypothetical protein [Lachnospiraceae bacterium]
MIVLNVITIALLMIVIPLFLGFILRELCGVSSDDVFEKYGFSYAMGHVIMWAVFQLVAVPLILVKSRLIIVTILWIVLLLVYLTFGVWYIKKHKSGGDDSSTEKQDKANESRFWLVMSIMLAAVVVGYQCYMYIFYMHIDDDDSRFVVNAVDAYEYGTMFLTNPATGNYEGIWVGELVKDVSSPWSIYLAMISKLLGIYPTILAHTVYPAFLLIAGYVSYYLIGKLLTKDRVKSFLMVAVVATVNMSFGESKYNQSYFSIVRIWQGKAVVAATLIPLLTYLLIRLYKNYKERSSYVLLVLTSMAMCLMSGMGIFFSGIMIGLFGGWFILINKGWKQIPYLMIACIPTIIYGLSYMMIK